MRTITALVLVALLGGCYPLPSERPKTKPWMCACGHDEDQHAVGWGVCLYNDFCEHFDRVDDGWCQRRFLRKQPDDLGTGK